MTPFSVHNRLEVAHWTSSLKLFTRVASDLLGEIPDGDKYLFGYSLLPAHQHVVTNLSKTLNVTANKTALALASL